MEQGRYRKIKSMIGSRLKKDRKDANEDRENERAIASGINSKKPIDGERGKTLSGGQIGMDRTESSTYGNVIDGQEDEETKKVARQLKYLRQNS